MKTECGQQGISEHGVCGFEIIYTAMVYRPTCHQNMVCHGKKVYF
jgi:hypothetical protein